ncbi:substrate-binding periplasmic protein [Kiloniella sp.]|uniref:substrate-binding periplasmic protein n=1 Tax=Kiloniella sp. TaxID=1938587 RepID=UPI003A959570
MTKFGNTPLISLFLCSCIINLFFIVPAHTQDDGTDSARSLYLVTEEYPPLNTVNSEGTITGLATELIRLAADENNIKLKIEMLPWKRAYHIAENRPSVCIYSTWRTAQREDDFLWIGPLAKDAWSFYAPKDKKIQLTSLEDTYRYRVGGIDGWAFTQYLQQKEHPYLDLIPIEDETNARKLQTGRIDLWATGRISGQQIIKHQDISNLEEVFAVREIGLWLACNPETDPSIIQDIQASLDKFEQDGTAHKTRTVFQF